MHQRITVALFLLSSLFLSAHRADAAILFTTGAMTEIAPPASFLAEALESSTEIVIVDEGSKFLVEEIFVDAFGPGPQLPAGPLMILPPGLFVNTYFVHFDPDGGVISLTGGVMFDPGETIIGMTLHTPYISASDGFPIGIPTTTYPTELATRGFETLPGIDTAFIAIDLNSVSFELIAELSVDQARIFTVFIPEPSAFALLMGALTISGICYRRAI